MAEETTIPPCVFVSYSWTSQEHIQRIVNFAERLVDDGVDVILDQWSLREGHDKYVYMEKMVTDKKVNKVLIFSDKRYQEKADQREGGVGTESQIISQETYEKVEQDKFIPIVLELDENNKPTLPVFFKNRLFIDFSNAENINKNWERLLRTIYNKPALNKPRLGKPPAYIFQEQTQYSSNRSSLEAFKRALLEDRSSYLPLARGYLDDFITTLEEHRLILSGETPLAEALLTNIKNMLPCRDELIEFYEYAFSYKNNPELLELVISFLEKCLLFNLPISPGGSQGAVLDNFKFFNHEQFIYLLAILIKYKRFSLANDFLTHEYYIPKRLSGNDAALVYYRYFYSASEILERENSRENPRRLSPTADLFKERATIPRLDFSQFMQADFILFLRSLVNGLGHRIWYPVTLVFSGWSNTFELFIRAKNDKEFEAIKFLLNTQSRAEFKQKYDAAIKEEHSELSALTFYADVSFDSLMNYAGIFKELLADQKA